MNPIVYLPLILMLVGCNSRSSNSPAFDMGGSLNRMPVKPEIFIIEPSAPLSVRVDKALYSTIEIKIRENGTLPVYLNAVLVAKGVERFVGRFEAKSAENDSFFLKAKLRMPDRPGSYQLRIDAVYLVDNFIVADKVDSERKKVVFAKIGPVMEVRR